MSAFTRLLGRDNQVRLTRAGVPLSSITAIKSSVVNFNTRTLTEQYLGETQNRKDMIFDDVTGTLVFHPEAKDQLTLIKAIVDRAIRRVNDGTEINLISTFRFPNGETGRLSFPELSFDPIPLNNSNRDAYVDVTLSWHAEKFGLL